MAFDLRIGSVRGITRALLPLPLPLLLLLLLLLVVVPLVRCRARRTVETLWAIWPSRQELR